LIYQTRGTVFVEPFRDHFWDTMRVQERAVLSQNCYCSTNIIFHQTTKSC